MMRMKKWQSIAAIVTFALMLIAIIVLSVFLGINTSRMNDSEANLENIYYANYYDLIGGLNTMENELKKASVINGRSLLETTLENVSAAADAADRALMVFANQSNGTRGLNKYINQTGDYCKYLVTKLEKGEVSFSDDERNNLSKMADIAKETATRLNSMRDKMGENFSFIENFASDNDIFAELLDNLNGEGGIDFPTLIYDGPFSDGLMDREPKGIHGEEISENQALTEAAKYLSEYETSEINVEGMSEYRIPSYIVTAKLKGEESRSVSLIIAKQGGMLLNLDMYKEVGEPTLTVDDCKTVAEQYLETIGIKNMKAVWATNNNSTVYVNLCYYDKGIVHYPDMIKIKVSLDTGEILGYEGLAYAFNHYDRVLDEPELSTEEALLLAPKQLTDLNARLTLIPTSVNTEKLAYEISGKIGGDIYFIYIDASTGDELQVFRVIDSSEGELLM